MCDTGNIMENQMDDQIQSGINDRNWCYQRIDDLERENKELIEERKSVLLAYTKWLVEYQILFYSGTIESLVKSFKSSINKLKTSKK
jgi:hypothetical protein